MSKAYLQRGFAVRLITRGASVPFSAGMAQLTRILRTLALLETVTEDRGFSSAPDPRLESVLVVPRGTSPRGRPTEVSHVMEAGR